MLCSGGGMLNAPRSQSPPHHGACHSSSGKRSLAARQRFSSLQTALNRRSQCRVSRATSGGNRGGGRENLRGFGSGGDDDDDPPNRGDLWKLFCCAVVGFSSGLLLTRVGKSIARTSEGELAEGSKISDNAIWQIKEGKWIRYVADEAKDEFVLDVVKENEEEAMSYERQCAEKEAEAKTRSFDDEKYPENRKLVADEIVSWCLDVLKTTMLPVGYPKTVSKDYTEYTIWRMGQVIASQISGVLTTQALLYAVGLGKGAIPTAAAINWVLKDGIGYLSKIVLSKYGRHFDVHPKSWRLLSDLIEDAANGLDLLTPTFPHLFVPLTAVSGAGKSAAGLIQAATRSCFYAGFATQQNFAEVIAKGEAQGMVSKSLGIAMGIAISSKAGSSGPLLVLSFAAVTAAHILCNLKSYQAVQLHTLNPYRTGLIMAEYLNRQEVLSVRDVNVVEPILLLNLFSKKQSDQVCISEETKQAAADIERNLQLGVSFGDAVNNKEVANALLDLYRGEEYMLTYRNGHYMVVLKQSASPYDMLRAVVQASYYRRVRSSADSDASPHELLKISYQSMHQNFDELIQRFKAAGWSAGGLVARPASNRILSFSS